MIGLHSVVWLCVNECLCLYELCVYLGEGLVIRAGEVVLVEVLGIEDNRTRMVGGARRQRQHLLLLLILPLLPGNFRLLGLKWDRRDNS